MIREEAGSIRFLWQEHVAGSGLKEVLDLAQKFNDSGLFDEKELASIRKELKEVALLLSKNLITRLTEDAPETRPPAKLWERRDKEFSKVRDQLNRLGQSLTKIS